MKKYLLPTILILSFITTSHVFALDKIKEMKSKSSELQTIVEEKIFNRFSTAIERFVKLQDRIESRATKLSEMGADVSEVEDDIILSKDSIDNAKNMIDSLSSPSENSTFAQFVKDNRNKLAKLRNTLSDIKDQLGIELEKLQEIENNLSDENPDNTN